MNEALEKLLQERIDYRQKLLTEAVTIKYLAGFLPEKIQNLPITGIDLSYDGKELTLTLDGGEATANALKECGAEGFTPKYSSWGGYWYLDNGIMDLNKDHEAVFTVRNTDKPPKCHIVKKRRTITEEVAVCEESGKEL